jgi:hypothetical protein
MPPLVFYKCPKCKSIRDTFEEAEKCESAHLSAVSVRELEYKFGAYPYRVILVFPDGKEKEYINDEGYFFAQGVNHANDKDKRNGKRHKSPC